MNALAKVLVLFLALGIGNVIYLIKKPKPVPEFPETWWGLDNVSKDDTEIRKFNITVPDGIIAGLQLRLKNLNPFTPPLEGANQNYGINTNLLQEIIDFWKTEYNWKERQVFLNKYSHFHTHIQGLRIHFIHEKPKNVPNDVTILPILLLHGWPGSFREFYEVIPKLTTVRKGQKFVFEVIVPSLPGYGFSNGAVKPGLGAAQMAVIFKNLMKRLGHDKYYIQGGDWGAGISSAMAVLFPERIKGVHSNFCISETLSAIIKMVAGSFFPRLVVDKEQEHRIYPLSNLFSYMMLEFGYAHLHATKPDTIGVALQDSPTGLAAYILEKFITWTNPEWKNRTDGGLKEKYNYADLLDNVMIYWVTNTITTSIRIYAESQQNNEQAVLNMPISVPTACAIFKNEILYQPKSFLSDKYTNLVHHKEFNDGGHFAAFEMPDVLANDIWEAIGKMEDLEK